MILESISTVSSRVDSCEIHKTHSPRAEELHRHHVWPLGMGGPDIESNKITICPTGHVNVHSLLRQYEHAGGTPSWDIRKRFGSAERNLAKRAWESAHPAHVTA